MKSLVTLLLFTIQLTALHAQKPLSKKMDVYLQEIEDLVPLRDSLNESVSKVDVAWHLDHALKVVNKLYESLESSRPEAYKYQFSLIRTLAFAWGDFPRGIAKSPTAVLPPKEIQTPELYAQLERARKNMERFRKLPKNSYYSHFIFKNINRKRTIRFLEVHTRHHLKIIRDILKS
ncbi:MAG: DUF1569 domain-containing protein [Bacteroidota bacterium]